LSTDYAKQIDILDEVFMGYRYDENFEDFIDFNDAGLPLAHLIHDGIVESTPMAEELIKESFGLLLEMFGIAEDTGFKNLKEISGET
jgi:hypothetical protein